VSHTERPHNFLPQSKAIKYTGVFYILHWRITLLPNLRQDWLQTGTFTHHSQNNIISSNDLPYAILPQASRFFIPALGYLYIDLVLLIYYYILTGNSLIGISNVPALGTTPHRRLDSNPAGTPIMRATRHYLLIAQ